MSNKPAVVADSLTREGRRSHGVAPHCRYRCLRASPPNRRSPMTATGTVKASFESAVPEDSITPDVRRQMYARNGAEYVAVVVLQVNSITVPADELEKDPAIKLKVLEIELAATSSDNNWTRELLQAWYRRRTADGTLEQGHLTADQAADVAKAVLTGNDSLEHFTGDAEVSVNGKTVKTLTDLADALADA